MSIADELREYAAHAVDRSDYMAGMTYDLDRIADRIDVEHEAACAEAYGNGVMSVPIALDESQWVKLPVDADGVPIHVGDVLTDGEHTFVVDELATFGNGSWSIRNEDENAWKACDVTHHHKPTVEDVLRQVIACANNSTHVHGALDTEQIVAEFAAKLRLAGDAE